METGQANNSGKNATVRMMELRRRQVDLLNRMPGSLRGFFCQQCNNKGVVYTLEDGYEVCRPCPCMRLRASHRRVEASGLHPQTLRCTFANFQTPHPWQQQIKENAMAYAEDCRDSWFYIGGQSGCGKTHICVSIAGVLLRRGIPCRYIMWREESVRLKALVGEERQYQERIAPLKEVAVLSIDDFLKTSLDSTMRKRLPTPGDLNLAFELINYRYLTGKATILASEWTVNELMECDEALASRILERARDHCFGVKPDRRKNYRLQESSPVGCW